MHNYKLTIQYDGTNFFGWQSQPGGNTVQDKITKTVRTVLREDINLIGSGRTDAGVHALGQAANFRTKNSVDLFKFRYSVNSVLPDSISISSVKLVNEDFMPDLMQKQEFIFICLLKINHLSTIGIHFTAQ